jgi:Fe-S-cluster containining protein
LFFEVFHDLKISEIPDLCKLRLLTRCKHVYMSDLLHNWEKKSADHQKDYKRFLQKAEKKSEWNRILDKLPDLHEEAFQKIDCLTCANCCKNYSPRFKPPDIKRIARHLKMKDSELISQYLRMDEDGDYVVRSTPCPFLGADNYCGIYEVRPSDCERFPYTDEDVFMKRATITQKNSTFCPIVYYVLEKLMI